MEGEVKVVVFSEPEGCIKGSVRFLCTIELSHVWCGSGWARNQDRTYGAVRSFPDLISAVLGCKLVT